MALDTVGKREEMRVQCLMGLLALAENAKDAVPRGLLMVCQSKALWETEEHGAWASQ